MSVDNLIDSVIKFSRENSIKSPVYIRADYIDNFLSNELTDISYINRLEDSSYWGLNPEPISYRILIKNLSNWFVESTTKKTELEKIQVFLKVFSEFPLLILFVFSAYGYKCQLNIESKSLQKVLQKSNECFSKRFSFSLTTNV